MISNSKQNRQKTPNAKRQKIGCLREQVENANLYKSLQNKIITTHNQAVCKKLL